MDDDDDSSIKLLIWSSCCMLNFFYFLWISAAVDDESIAKMEIDKFCPHATTKPEIFLRINLNKNVLNIRDLVASYYYL